MINILGSAAIPIPVADAIHIILKYGTDHRGLIARFVILHVRDIIIIIWSVGHIGRDPVS